MCFGSLLTSQIETSIPRFLECINKYHAKWAESKCQNTSCQKRLVGGLLMSVAIKILINNEDQKKLMDSETHNGVN